MSNCSEEALASQDIFINLSRTRTSELVKGNSCQTLLQSAMHNGTNSRPQLNNVMVTGAGVVQKVPKSKAEQDKAAPLLSKSSTMRHHRQQRLNTTTPLSRTIAKLGPTVAADKNIRALYEHLI